MQIRRIDAAEFDRFHGLLTRARASVSDYPTGIGLAASRVLFSGDHADTRCTGFAATEGADWFGIAWLDEDLLENTDVVQVEIAVAPEHRRRGFGSALLAATEDYARSQHRPSLRATLNAPYEGTTIRSPGTSFAERHGFARKHVELHQVLELPVPATTLEQIAGRIAGQHTGYRLLQWHGPCPDEWVAELCDLFGLVEREVPSGELEVEASVWTPERLRALEARQEQQGRGYSTTVAVSPDGRLAGYSQVGGSRDNPAQLYQWVTLVRPEHRGHRLGMAVKLPNLRAMQDRLDRPAVVHTWNAPGNAPMIAVNDRLGFRAVEYRCNYQRTL